MKVVDVKDFGPTGFRVRFWETAERTTRRGDVDGVAIIAKVLRSGQAPHIVVISQFRPPLGRHCLELPAGLVDAGEDAAQAAVRELQEETGYTGVVVEVTPDCDSDPGMSGANMQLAVLEVDGDAPQNQAVVPHLEDGEFISTSLVPLNGLLNYLLETKRAKGWGVDARLMSFAVGLQLGAASATAAAVAAVGSAAPPGQVLGELSAFGSVLPTDGELAAAAEAALAAAGAPAGGPGGASMVEFVVREAESVAGQPLLSQGVNGVKRPKHSSHEAPGWQRSWQVVRGAVCSPQFAAGMATGLAVAALAWRRR
ncbi:hypothetical protein N2152v2_005142 [Parachlorella kessleri]